ncbi:MULTISPECIES: HAMP domain-containing sensor histidine kinase [unclassified Nitratiruptor]|uniref:sensor histidine kinase n=1 Tax=unclassified Nitratiruptor TaxID=2624044 RepID=UPI001915B516|nr:MULTISPECIES: HAMP domain-containing sensor histidine kinase [unclassified Nitratiruptor]BCD61113.1 histidine kinase [Nitratiruptor sp. YY08-10]BCD65046.1 histidine kinase [Nitratiruptor sp. YY08-14]
MILDAKKYAFRYAILYTLIIGILLFVPLFVYTSLVLNINEAKNERDLKEVALKIVGKMEEYNNDGIFQYPRFAGYKSGLYDVNFHPVFSLLDFTPTAFSEGYHKQRTKRYYIVELPENLYFGAKYLIVSKEFDPWKIYRTSFLIGFGIVFILLLFSYIVLKNFSYPFEKVNQTLDNFIKDSMHEINTPLSIINVNIDLFTRKFGENSYLSRIKSAAKTLSNIYNDMDYLIKKDRIEYKNEKIDFSSFLQERVDYFQEIANLRKISLVAKIETDITIYMNRTKLQRIVDNTLSNAIKYSKERSCVKIYLKKVGDQAVLTIKDYGIGIENPQKIFERFYREDHDKGGFGIGLCIVQNIVQQEDIGLKVVSKPGKGTAFIYYFKLFA